MSMGRSPSKSFISIGGYVDLRGLLNLAENHSSVCIVEGFAREASAMEFDVRIDLQWKQVGQESSAVHAMVEVGKEVHDFDLMNGSIGLVNLIASLIEDQGNNRKSS